MISRDHILSLLAVFCTCLPSVAGQGAVVHLPKKYGLLDAEGKVISACHWDSAGEFYHGATIVKKEGKVGLLNAKGELFIPCIWDDVRWFFHENRAVVLKDDKMGYIDRSGKVVIKLEWDWCGEFRGNLAEVERDGLYGLIDLNGKVVVKPEWDEIRFDKAYVMCVRDKKILLMNTKAEILHPTMWDKVTIYSDELVAGKKGFESTFLDSKGEVIVDGVIRIGHDRNQLEKYDIFSIQKEEGWGYISREGELQSMPQWDKEILFDKNQVVVSKGGVDHILYRSGKQVAVTDYYVHMLFERVWLVEDKKTKKMGYMDESFKLIVPCVWGRESREASDGRIVVENEGLFGAINVRGEVIIPAVWDELDSFLNGEPSVVGRNGKYGFVDRNGKLISVWSKTHFPPNQVI